MAQIIQEQDAEKQQLMLKCQTLKRHKLQECLQSTKESLMNKTLNKNNKMRMEIQINTLTRILKQCKFNKIIKMREMLV